CAQKGFEVIVCGKNDSILEHGVNSINAALSKLTESGKISGRDKEHTFGRIKGASEFKWLENCDLVIEAVTEDLGLKKEIFAELDSICHAETIFATNTSVLPVIEIAHSTSRPDKLLGTHFLPPPPVNPLLEIVRTLDVDNAIFKKVKEFGQHLGKRVIESKDSPGFIVNRILTPILLNAVHLLEEGVAEKEDIETAVKFGLGMPMGPFELLDLIGLDTIVSGTDSLFRELNDPQYFCPVTIRRMAGAGMLGRKAGKGFYDYTFRDKESGG
ncbi:MAG: 3-hydroxybutyryl-CoA dehydrogenase, partial [Desulfobacteraceae bacterium]|nr:3-hydroxybutyryl-CoA dehydrogenase [Desulfobacteraceae bacterium]